MNNKKQPLNILINEDFEEKETRKFSEDFNKLEIDYIQVRDYSEFERLVFELRPEREVIIWIHANVSLKNHRKLVKAPGETIAQRIEIDKEKIKFKIVTRFKASVSDEIIKKYTVLEIDEVLSNIREMKPQTVAEIRGEELPEIYEDYDIVVINAIQEEQNPIKDYIKLSQNNKQKIGTHKLISGKILTKTRKSISIGLVKQHKMGMVDAALLTTQVIDLLKPKIVIMTGVCAGKPDDKEINFGDIIIPHQLFTFQFGKISDSPDDNEKTIFHKELQVESSSSSLISNISPIKDSIIKKIRVDALGNPKFKQLAPNLNAHLEGNMACSTSVINKSKYFEDTIKPEDRKAIAVEMESFAIARACNQSVLKPECLIIKSVMDKAQKKNNIYKEYAAFTSARFLYYLVYDEVI